MARKELEDAWKQSERLITKGRFDEALALLREADPDSRGGKETHHRTMRLAPMALHGKADAVSDFRPTSLLRNAHSLAEDAVRKSPQDRESNRLLNEIRNTMQDRGVRASAVPRMVINGTPTPFGLLMGTALVLLSIVAVFQLATLDAGNGPEGVDEFVSMRVAYTDASGEEVEGRMLIQLDHVNAPLAADSFAKHVRNGAYDGVAFHRTIDDFMIQGGDITCGIEGATCTAGTGGHAADFYGLCDGRPSLTPCSSETQYSLPDEATNNVTHEPYRIAMANSGPDSGGSQFYIMDEDSFPTNLDYTPGKDCTPAQVSCHTLFGEVIEGREHVRAIAEGPTGANDVPTNPVTILSAVIEGEGDSGGFFGFL